jgi:hypothetical protein
MPKPALEYELLDIRISPSVGARLLGLSKPAVDFAEKKGAFSRGSDGRYLLPDFIRGYILMVRNGRGSDRKAAQEKLINTRIKEAELKLAERTAELVPKTQAFDTFTELTSSLIGKFDGLPAQFTRNLIERRKLQKLINEIRNEWAVELRKASGPARTPRVVGSNNAARIPRRVGGKAKNISKVRRRPRAS